MFWARVVEAVIVNPELEEWIDMVHAATIRATIRISANNRYSTEPEVRHKSAKVS